MPLASVGSYKTVLKKYFKQNFKRTVQEKNMNDEKKILFNTKSCTIR